MSDEDAGTYIRALLAGSSPNGVPPEAFGEYHDVITGLLAAHQAGGTPMVREAWESIVRRHPGLMALVSGDEAEPEGWQLFTLADAYAPRPPTRYVVEDLFPLPSLSVVYGPPGSLKSLILADLAVCVAAGLPWLPPMPREAGLPKAVSPVPVFWADFDNGPRLTHARFEALARARDLPTSTPLAYVSLPSPWLDASSWATLAPLNAAIEAHQAQLVVLDNLTMIKGEADENSADMGTVMANLRRVCERRECVLIVVHHQRKDQGGSSRAGDRLRGHSSIEAALDLALLVEREPQSASLTLRSTKERGLEVAPFGAMFTYEHKGGTKDLATAKFYGLAVEDTHSDRAIAQAVRSVLTTHPLTPKTELCARVHGQLPKVGINRIRAVVDRMEQQGTVKVTPGEGRTLRYSSA